MDLNDWREWYVVAGRIKRGANSLVNSLFITITCYQQLTLLEVIIRTKAYTTVIRVEDHTLFCFEVLKMGKEVHLQLNSSRKGDTIVFNLTPKTRACAKLAPSIFADVG